MIFSKLNIGELFTLSASAPGVDNGALTGLYLTRVDTDETENLSTDWLGAYLRNIRGSMALMHQVNAMMRMLNLVLAANGMQLVRLGYCHRETHEIVDQAYVTAKGLATYDPRPDIKVFERGILDAALELTDPPDEKTLNREFPRFFIFGAWACKYHIFDQQGNFTLAMLYEVQRIE